MQTNQICKRCKIELPEGMHLSALDTCPACVGDWVKDYHRPNRTPDGYTLNTYADGFGRWHTQIKFSTALGNTAEAERIANNALKAAKRAIRGSIVERMQPTPTRRLSYEVTANEFQPGSGCLRALTISEK